MSLKMVFEKLCKRVTDDLEPGLNVLEAAKIHSDCLIQYEIYRGKTGYNLRENFLQSFMQENGRIKFQLEDGI